MPHNHSSFGHDHDGIPSGPHANGGDANPMWDCKFQGMRLDPNDHMFYERQRSYSPTVKPWANHEPMGYVDGLNVYAAPVDDPVNPVNPLGT